MAPSSTPTTVTALPEGVTAGTWVIDESHTEAGFSVRHAGVSRVRGSFTKVSGTVQIGDSIEASTVAVEIDTASIHTRNEGRDEHLRSADFFDVENHPKMTFQSTGVRVNGDEILIDGELTIRGTTQPVTLNAEFNGLVVDPYQRQVIGMSATTQISRKDFGLTWNVLLEAGSMMVGDTIKIEIETELNPEG